MRAIANEQLQGFPKRNGLSSVLAEHETEDEEVGVQDERLPDPERGQVAHLQQIYKLETPVKEEQCKELMKSTGFGYLGGPDLASNLELPVTSYSNGWHMKVQLCAAQVTNCECSCLMSSLVNWAWERQEARGPEAEDIPGSERHTLTVFVEKYPERRAYFELCKRR